MSLNGLEGYDGIKAVASLSELCSNDYFVPANAILWQRDLTPLRPQFNLLAKELISNDQYRAQILKEQGIAGFSRRALCDMFQNLSGDVQQALEIVLTDMEEMGNADIGFSRPALSLIRSYDFDTKERGGSSAQLHHDRVTCAFGRTICTYNLLPTGFARNEDVIHVTEKNYRQLGANPPS